MGSEFTEVGLHPDPEDRIFRPDPGYCQGDSDSSSVGMCCSEGLGGLAQDANKSLDSPLIEGSR